MTGEAGALVLFMCVWPCQEFIAEMRHSENETSVGS